MRRFNFAVLFGSAIALGACTAEAPVGPEAEEVLASTDVMSLQSVDLSAAPPPRFIVTFRGKSPRDLQSTVETAGGSVDAVYERYGFAVVSGIEDGALSGIRALRGVTEAAAEPMFSLEVPMTAGVLEAAAPASPAQPSTAFFFGIQWHLPAIGAPAAWSAGRLGSSDATVAILDSGIDPTHLDIMGRVDMTRSAVFDFTDVPVIEFFLPGLGLDPITDIHFHGTHVASIVSSNAFVGAGVTSQTTLMVVKVCNVTNACPGAAVFEGLIHAIENGADVINMSLGGAFDKAGANGFGSIINGLFNAAKQAGVTVVVAAGNDAADLDHNGSLFATYCDAPHVICVSATAPSSSEDVQIGPWHDIDAPASYTNFGRSGISVAAPGGDAAGFVVGACSSFSLLLAEPPARPCDGGTFALFVAGTSQAAPAVSGLAALLVEDYGRNPAKIAAAIRKGADDLGQPGTDPYYGKGRINIPATLGIE